MVTEPQQDAEFSGYVPADVEEAQGMAELLEGETQGLRSLRRGDIIDGVVMRVDRDNILVDIGGKTEGIVPAHEMRSLTPEEFRDLHIGSDLLVYVLSPENQEGQVVLSLDRATGERGWRTLQQRFDAGEMIEAEVVGLAFFGAKRWFPVSLGDGLGASHE